MNFGRSLSRYGTTSLTRPNTFVSNAESVVKIKLLQNVQENSCLKIVRRIQSKHSESMTSKLLNFFRESRSNGTLEIVLGSTILAVVGIDYALQTRNDDQKKEMLRLLERHIKFDAEASRKEEEMEIRDEDEHILFQCIVRRVPLNFDGHKCLTNIKVGDILNVLQEGVGPGNQYNLCSIDRNLSRNVDLKPNDDDDTRGVVSKGWFPCSCLERRVS